jgi:hypothetical protein
VKEWVDFITNNLGLEEAEGKSGPLVDPVGVAEYLRGEVMIPLRGNDYRTGSCFSHITFDFPATPDDRGVDRGLRPVRTIFDKK